MKMIKGLLIKYRELIVYVICGVATTVVNLLTFKLFNLIFGEELYLVSNIVAWFVSVVFAYITNKLLVFESRSWKGSVIFKEITSFFAARVLSFGIEEAGLFLFVDLLSFDAHELSFGFIGLDFSIGGHMIAKIILSVIVVVLNYIFSKLFIFKKKKEE